MADEHQNEQDLQDSLQSTEHLKQLSDDDRVLSLCQEMLTDDGFDAEVSISSPSLCHIRRHIVGSSAVDCDERSDAAASIATVVGSLSPSEDEMSLGLIDRFDVFDVIGSGGMGIVLKAHDPSLKREVAIKVLSPSRAFSSTAKRYFLREAHATASVSHPNVISIYEVSEHANLPYLVMPFLGNQTLQTVIDESALLDVRAILAISASVARGLAAAHQQGLVHRDIKPSNILIEENTDRVVVSDFGLARTIDSGSHTEIGSLAGTPGYMSPEQALGQALDHRSDLFSLGSLIYAMCTGEAPFRDQNSLKVLREVTDASPAPIEDQRSDVPSWLIWLIKKLHAKNPEDRIESASEVVSLLEQCQKHLDQPTNFKIPTLLRDPPSKINLRNRLLAGAGLFILMIAALVWANSGQHSDGGQHSDSDRYVDSVPILADTKEPTPGSDSRVAATPIEIPVGPSHVSLNDMLLRYKETAIGSDHEIRTRQLIMDHYMAVLQRSSPAEMSAVRSQWAAALLPIVLGEISPSKAKLFISISLSRASGPASRSAMIAQELSNGDWELKTICALAYGRRLQIDHAERLFNRLTEEVTLYARENSGWDAPKTYFGEKSTCRAVINQLKIYRKLVAALGTRQQATSESEDTRKE